jgi:hypothetical protein
MKQIFWLPTYEIEGFQNFSCFLFLWLRETKNGQMVGFHKFERYQFSGACVEKCSFR